MNQEIYSLSKFIAHAGLCARRKALELIEQGVVIVNGEKIVEPGYKVKKTDQIFVSGKKAELKKNYTYILLNKPRGCFSTVSDEKGRLTVLDLVATREARMYPVGRLDVQTTGLILLTNDGAFAQKLAHPSFGVQKEYQVLLDKPVTDEDIQKIQKGMRFSDGFVKVDRVYRPAKKPFNHVGIVIHSGKYRIIRRIFERLGYNVITLDRVAYAGLRKKGLALGSWRRLDKAEIKQLKERNK